MTEYMYLNRLPPPVMQEILNRTLIVRWLDDVLHVYPKNLSHLAKRAIRRLQSRNFYGGTLELIEDLKASVAFGFWVQQRHGRVLIREKLTFLRDDPSPEEIQEHVWALVAPDWQFGAKKTSYNIMYGRLTRHLDTTNGAEEDVIAGLCRIISELSYVGYELSLIQKAVKQVSLTATLNLNPVLKFALVPSQQMRSWSKAYDRFVHQLWGLKSRLCAIDRLTTR